MIQVTQEEKENKDGTQYLPNLGKMWGTCHCGGGLIRGTRVAEVPFLQCLPGFPPCSPHKLKLLSSNWKLKSHFVNVLPLNRVHQFFLFILASGLNGETKSNFLLFTKINFTRNRQLDSYSLF